MILCNLRKLSQKIGCVVYSRCIGLEIRSLTVVKFGTMTTLLKSSNATRLFLVGDVMLGRGVDQILKFHCEPILYEGYITDARDYVKLAVEKNGPLPTDRTVEYIWGDALQVLDRFQPDVRMINLETAVTINSESWPGKGIHYRMHPKNVDVLQVAKLDCIVLANNHVLDWHYEGLKETLDSLQSAQLTTVGAGKTAEEAEKPAIFTLANNRRVIVFAFGHSSSGVPQAWRATATKPGVNYIEITNLKEISDLAEKIRSIKREGDVVVVSIHWGSNWDFDLESGQQRFAQKLIDEAGVDLIYGHSSHHVKGVEIYKGKLIIYGCGDFLSDYEGINGIGSMLGGGFRDDVSFMYFPDLDAHSGRLLQLYMIPMRLKHIQVRHAKEQKDLDWLFNTMKRECQKFGTEIEKAEGAQNYFKLKF